MSILLSKDTTFIVQGITGREAVNLTKECLDYGSKVVGGVTAAQGLAAQSQINYTRSNEAEADRVGIGILAAAGFDPVGMPDFFGTMQQRSGTAGRNIPDLLRSHPVTSERIAETRDRATRMPRSGSPARSTSST